MSDEGWDGFFDPKGVDAPSDEIDALTDDELLDARFDDDDTPEPRIWQRIKQFWSGLWK